MGNGPSRKHLRVPREKKGEVQVPHLGLEGQPLRIEIGTVKQKMLDRMVARAALAARRRNLFASRPTEEMETKANVTCPALQQHGGVLPVKLHIITPTLVAPSLNERRNLKREIQPP